MARRSSITTVRGKPPVVQKNPAKKPGVSGDTPKTRNALNSLKKK